MIAALLAVPAVAGAVAYLLHSDAQRRGVLVAAALAHAGLAVACIVRPPAPVAGGWLGLDPLGRFFLIITSLLFACAALYAVGYLRREGGAVRRDLEDGLLFVNAPEATFTACLLFFVAAMTLVAMSRHFGVLWIAIEATTLTSAPLIYFHRQHRSLEATWKYLLICSVGIALALLGGFFLAVAATGRGGHPLPLVVDALIAAGPHLHPAWLRAAFIFFLVGYGTKMGLAPLHTWLPDAHSEAPSVVSALLSGALLNCAFLGIVRVQQVCAAAGEAAFGQSLLVVFGLLSIAAAAVFIVNQTDYKRLLAYSSVEHMGIVALGVGLGGTAAFGALLHALNHSVVKAMLFLVAGNLVAAYRSKEVAAVRGALRRVPASGALWLAGLFAITGCPPFGTFLSELVVLRGAIDAGRGGVAVLYLGLLAVVFIGMSAAVLPMAQGAAPAEGDYGPARREAWLAILPPAALVTVAGVLGLYIPGPLQGLIAQAARALP